MAPAYFLKIDGVEGESRDPDHLGELELESVDWEAPAGGGACVVDFAARSSRASPALFVACADGTRIANAVLTIHDPEAAAGATRRWRFSEVVVSGYATEGRGEEPLDHVTLSAALQEELPPPAPAALRIELIRPDDLLNLELSALNLRLDGGAEPALVVDDPEQPARLIVTFPPQTIAETAYFRSSPVPGEEPAPDPGNPPPPPPGERPLDLPGEVGGSPVFPRTGVARLADRSRLAFDVPAGARLPLTVEGLLDWSGLEPAVSPIAAIPPDPTAEQIAAAPAIRPPEAAETALELPYRLVISPNRAVSWIHRSGPFTSRGRTELWHTRLGLRTPEGVVETSRADPAPLRAIWSPDYHPFDPPAPTEVDPDLGLTAMAPNDRHQIVILTSAFHGYEYEVDLELFPVFKAARPAGAALRRVPLRRTFPYVPEPFGAELLMLSPLGGWLRSRGHWTPPYQVLRGFPSRPDLRAVLSLVDAPLQRDVAAHAGSPAGAGAPTAAELLPAVLAPLERQGERLDLSEWVHVAAQGRDHYVRIVYEGELKPFGNRAALIKVTERKFAQNGGIVGAYLFQRMFIVVREPEKTFAEADRGMPFKHVRLTTLVTPDIAYPAVIPGTERSFWVEVTAGAGTERFAFHGVGTDVAGNEVDFTIPMMFVSIKETETTLPLALAEYNRSTSAGLLASRDLRIPGQQLAFAKPDADPARRNTQLVTESLNLVLDPAGGGPELLKAEVRIPQVQELLGTDAPTTIRLFGGYVAGDFDAATGVFAEIAKPDFGKFTAADPLAGMVADTLGVDFSSDKAGGFATPNLGVATLSRDLGPLAGKVADALTDTFDPASFFPAGLAKLFGSFDLGDLLPASTLGTNAPKLRTSTSDIPDGKLVVTTLDWAPEVRNRDLVVVAFEKDRGGAHTQLEVRGVIKKTVKLAGAPEPPTFEFTGTLNDFQVSVLKSVFVNFVEFSFTARSEQKPDVTVRLDPAKPVEFGGDLKFVEELRKAIPPGLFGDGPSLDIAPTGIRAGFAIALPPLAVGVFSLQEVSLGAALTLPFTDGKPVFDFNVSQREHPFCLAVAIFGGGGFFHLQLDTAGIKELEAALEFGATASLDLGVASGSVHMMAGIYFSLQRQEPGNDLAATLSGYLRVGGSLSVLALITVSVEFNLSFTYDSGKDKAYGRATLTVEVEIAFFSTSVDLTVERGFGGQSGDPKFADLFTAPQVWTEYAKAFA